MGAFSKTKQKVQEGKMKRNYRSFFQSYDTSTKLAWQAFEKVPFPSFMRAYLYQVPARLNLHEELLGEDGQSGVTNIES